MYKLMNAVHNDSYDEGAIGNCRWMYSPTDNDLAAGELSLASDSNFDRWANSRVVIVTASLWDSNDPEFEKFVKKLTMLFSIEPEDSKFLKEGN